MYAAALLAGTLWLALGTPAACQFTNLTVCGPPCQLAQRQTLLQLYNSSGGQGWYDQTGWADYIANPYQGWPADIHCFWFGITCCSLQPGDDSYVPTAWQPCNRTTADSAVVGVFLGSNNLTGSLPPHESMLALAFSLQYLDASGNGGLRGASPPDLDQLPVLRGVWLQNCNFTGQLDTNFFQHAYIKFVQLSGNRFTGTLPPLSQAVALEELLLSGNQLTGSLPADWADTPTLRRLDIGGNQLTGTIPTPTQAVRHANLDNLILRRNKLSGTIPHIDFTFTSIIDLSGNQLSGAVSTVFDDCWLLETLTLSRNQLTGSLPTLTASSHLVELVLDDNRFSGTIPERWNELGSMEVLHLANNNLSGSLPQTPSWSAMEALDIRQSGLTQSSSVAHDADGHDDDRLPTYLAHDLVVGVQPVGNGMLCPQIVRQHTPAVPNMLRVAVDPAYDDSQHCICAPGFELTGVVNGNLRCVPAKHQFNDLWLGPVASAVVICCAVAYYALRKSLARVQQTRKHGPPELGQPVTLVLTDVEGSTELWEWAHQVMSSAITMHDCVMRSLLSTYNGYEVTTEGDAFVLAFHTPADAIAYCVAAQHELLVADWPEDLLVHPASCMKNAQGVVTTQDVSLVDPAVLAASLLQRGLRVRMGITTGIVDHTQVHALTRRVEYAGLVMDLGKAISDTPHGGQIIMDEVTCNQLLPHLRHVAARVRREPDREALRHFLSINHAQASDDHLYSIGLEEGARHGTSGRGHQRGQAMATVHPESRPFLDPEEPEVHQQPLLSRSAAQASRMPSLEEATIQFLSEGCHVLQSIAEPQTLFQVLIPGLEERAREWQGLKSVRQLAAGYFDAPAAQQAVLGRSIPSALAPALPIVTLAHCAIEGYQEMTKHDSQASDLACSLYIDCVRQQLSSRNGYECAQHQSAVLAAFRTPAEALQFCIMVQERMLDIPWDASIRAMPACRIAHDKYGQLMFSGPRIKMCLWSGSPTAVGPDALTGYAMYQGQIVSRAVGNCICAAHGGEILASWDFLERLVHSWTGDNPVIPPLGSVATIQVHLTRPRGSEALSGRNTPDESVHRNRRASQCIPEQSLPPLLTATATQDYQAAVAAAPADMKCPAYSTIVAPRFKIRYAGTSAPGRRVPLTQRPAWAGLRIPLPLADAARLAGTRRGSAPPAVLRDAIPSASMQSGTGQDPQSPSGMDEVATQHDQPTDMALAQRRLRHTTSNASCSMNQINAAQHAQQADIVAAQSRLRHTTSSDAYSMHHLAAQHGQQADEVPRESRLRHTSSNRALTTHQGAAQQGQQASEEVLRESRLRHTSSNKLLSMDQGAAQHAQQADQLGQPGRTLSLVEDAWHGWRGNPPQTARACPDLAPSAMHAWNGWRWLNQPQQGSRWDNLYANGVCEPDPATKQPPQASARILAEGEPSDIADLADDMGSNAISLPQEPSSPVDDVTEPPRMSCNLGNPRHGLPALVADIPEQPSTSSSATSPPGLPIELGAGARSNSSEASSNDLRRRIKRHTVLEAQQLMQDPWQQVAQIEVHHIGKVALVSGAPDPQTIVRLCSGRLAARVFPAVLATPKAQLVKQGRGHLWTLKLEHASLVPVAAPRKPRKQQQPPEADKPALANRRGWRITLQN